MEQATIYYLNWDREDGNYGPASTLFHKVSVESVLDEDEKPRTHYTEESFDDLYREIADFDLESQQMDEALRETWRAWNRGSGEEAREFIELRYCGQCDSYREGQGEAVDHAIENHGHDQYKSVEPDYVRGVRSMSAGDVVEIQDQYFRAKAIGWDEITVGDGI